MSRRSVPRSPLPEIHITNRQRSLRVDLGRIRKLVDAALPLCLARRGTLPAFLGKLREIDVSIVSPSAMSRIHIDFLGIDGPTDVITFPYGEIVVCASIAKENSERYASTLDDEVALYIIHGLLHLNGFDDLEPSPARRMRTWQAKILNAARQLH